MSKLNRYDFFKDEKMTIWYRGKFEIECSTYEEAVEKVKEMEKNPLLYDDVDIRWEIVEETVEGLSVEDNGGQPTVEIRSSDTDEMIYDNVKTN
jgi:hypothetical protein